MEHTRNWVAVVGMEVVRGNQRKVPAACPVVAVGSLVKVVSNLVEAARKLEAAVAGQSHVLVARNPEAEAVVAVAADTAVLVVIVVADVSLKVSVDVLLQVSVGDPVVEMSAADAVVRVIVGVPVVGPVLEEAYEAVQSANSAVLVVKAIEEAYVVNPTVACRFVVA